MVTLPQPLKQKANSTQKVSTINTDKAAEGLQIATRKDQRPLGKL